MPNLIRRVMLRALTRRTVTIDNRHPARPNLRLEALEDRTVPAVYNVYAIDAANGVNSGKVFVDDVETVLPSAYDPSDVPTPPPANNYTLINDAFAALLDDNDDVIVLHGTFDWSTGAAFDSWALGSDGKADTFDEYSIYVQADLNNVTITAGAPVNGVYGAIIKGPGDIPEVNAEGFLYFGIDEPGTNQDWTISNLQIEGFDGAIQMYNFDEGSPDAYSGTMITNNKIIVPADVDSEDDDEGNVGILVGFGTDQTIQNNTILIAGTGTSGETTFAASSGIEIQFQNVTVVGAVYDNLDIDSNTIRVTGAHDKTSPALVIGVVDNSHASGSNISVDNNSFFGSQADRATSLERGFQITAHSTLSKTVRYFGNTVQGANIGFQWQSDADFSGSEPISFSNNLVTGTETGVLIQSNGVAELNRNTISNNTTGVRVETGTLTAVVRSTITGNGTGISIGAGAGSIGPVEFSNLSGNTGLAIENLTGVVIDAPDNWWGSSNPTVVAAKHSANVDSDGFVTAPFGPSFFSTAAALINTTAPTPFTVVTSDPDTNLTVAGTLPPGFMLDDNDDGTATLTSSGSPVSGTFTFTIVADNGTDAPVRQTFTLTVVTPPTITSASTTTFTRGEFDSFEVETVDGLPNDTTLSLTGTLPPGVSFNPATGELSGIPTVGGSFALTFTASNGPNSSTTQAFTLNVVGAPTFGPISSITNLTVGVPMTPVTVTTSGVPTGSISTTNSLNPLVPGLPPGLILTDNGNGTATISGTPTAGGTTTGITLTTSNVFGSSTSAAFSVTVFKAPTFTTGTTANFARGVQNVFPVRVTPGFPVANNFFGTLPNGTALPAWIRLVKVSNTQANLIATPPANAQFAQPAINVRVVATNGQRASVQIVTVRLFNRAAPTFVAFSVPTLTVGVAMTPVTVRTTGFPFAAITSVGNALPAGLTLTNNGNGTATISGTPTGPGGVRGGLKLRATNALGTAVSVTFSITVNQAPTFLSPASPSSIPAGVGITFIVNTSGFPKPTILRTSGTLPTGMTFNSTGNGTATFSTTAATPAGTYVFDLLATNGVLPSVNQTLTLTIA